MALSLALSGVLVSALSAAAAPDANLVNVPQNGKLIIEGHGYGHGHGMSQYGAEGAARQGLGWRKILKFYYPGTNHATQKGRVRVLISANSTPRVTVGAMSGLRVRSHDRKVTKMLPTKVRRATPTRWRLRSTAAGVTQVQFRKQGWQTWWQFRGEGSFRAGGKPIRLLTGGGQSTRYRGRLVLAGSSNRRTDTVNDVALDSYIRGVIPREMPPLWHPDAVRSQAVAARTYAAYEMRHPRAGHYQLCDTTSCQVYGGYDAEHPASNAAVKATAGVVLHHGGTPAFTQFASSSGGWTAANQFSYLPAQPDPYDDWAGNPVHDWQVPLTAARIEAAWPTIGRLTRVRVTARDGNGAWGGRVRTLVLTGSNGQVTVTGDSFRFTLGLRSTWFRITTA